MGQALRLAPQVILSGAKGQKYIQTLYYESYRQGQNLSENKV